MTTLQVYGLILCALIIIAAIIYILFFRKDELLEAYIEAVKEENKNNNEQL